MKQAKPTTPLNQRLALLGEMIRLRILRLLEREELAVGEVANVVQLPQSTVSRHLKVLADGGWLGKRTEGTATLYRLILDDLPADLRALWLTVRPQLDDEASAELAEDSRRLAGVLAERTADSQTFFGRVAGQWDDVRADLFGRLASLRALLPLLPRDWAVADLGCGTGNASELLAPIVRKVIAVDQSAPMLKAAQKRLLGGGGGGGAGVRNVDFRRGELESLPIADAEVDAAVCVLVLHHVPEPDKALAEMRRILKPGGVALVVDMLEHDRTSYKHTMGHRWLGFAPGRMADMMTAAGLTDPRTVPLSPDPTAKGPGLFACTAFAPSKQRRN